VSVQQARVAVRSIEAGRLVCDAAVPGASRAVALDPDGRRVAVGTTDGRVMVMAGSYARSAAARQHPRTRTSLSC
jgi:hypothetical protein